MHTVINILINTRSRGQTKANVVTVYTRNEIRFYCWVAAVVRVNLSPATFEHSVDSHTDVIRNDSVIILYIKL